MVVIDLVPQHDPEHFRLLLGCSSRAPVSHGYVLNPAQVDSVVDMAQLVHIASFNLYGHGEGCDRRQGCVLEESFPAYFLFLAR